MYKILEITQSFKNSKPLGITWVHSPFLQLFQIYYTKVSVELHCLPASALDRWPGVFPNGVFIHLYLSEQHSCWTRVKIQYAPIWNFSQNFNVLVNPSSQALFFFNKFSKNTWNLKYSVKQWNNSSLLEHHTRANFSK